MFDNFKIAVKEKIYTHSMRTPCSSNHVVTCSTFFCQCNQCNQIKSFFFACLIYTHKCLSLSLKKHKNHPSSPWTVLYIILPRKLLASPKFHLISHAPHECWRFSLLICDNSYQTGSCGGEHFQVKGDVGFCSKTFGTSKPFYRVPAYSTHLFFWYT